MYCRRNPQGLDKVILIKAESEIIAWALVQFNLDAEGANVYFWVVPKYRRKGLGARLLYHSKKLDEKPYVFPHDRQSGEFFKKHLSDIRFAPYDGYWLTHTDESAIL
jgi:GNAT superfamily N-acetyltransferase